MKSAVTSTIKNISRNIAEITLNDTVDPKELFLRSHVQIIKIVTLLFIQSILIQ